MSLFRPFALSLIGLSTGLAQDEAPLPPGGVLIPPSNPSNPGIPPQVPANPANPAATAPGVQPAAGAVPLSEQRITEAIVEPKLSGTALAGLYRKYTGRRVIVSAAAALAEFSFVQDASPTDFLTFAQAAELLKKAATIENFVFVPDSSDPNLDILTISTGGINPRSRGISIFTESDTLPEGDAVISYVMNLQYLKPDEAVRTFTAIIGQFGTYGSIAPVSNAAAVVITENTSLIRKLIDLKKEIDKPSSQVATRFIKVEYADVTELATTLNELFAAQQTAQTTAGTQRADFNNGGGNAAAGAVAGAIGDLTGQAGGSSAGEATPVQIIAEPRTNRLFARGRPVDLLFVEGLVREFDIQSDQRNFLRRKLKFLKVSEFLPIAGDALTRAYSGTSSEGGAAGGGGGGAGAAGAGNRGNTGNRANTAATNNRSNTSASNFGGGAGGAGGSTGSATGGAGLGDPNVNTAPESLLVARTLVGADNITNSVVVQGPPSGVELIERLLDEIDVKPDQVMISCVFAQLALSEGYSFGVDYVSTLNGNLAGRGGSGRGGVVDLRPGTVTRGTPGTSTTTITDGVSRTVITGATPDVTIPTLFDPGNLAAAAGLDLYGKIGNNLNVYLNAKQNDSNFKVLSRPTIFTANNQKGSIISGTQIAVPTNSYTSGTSTTSSTNYEYKDVALQLEVIPLINSANEVTLQIALTSDDVGTDRSVGTGDSAYLIPDILKRELNTTVTVPNRETIVLGGLITETTNDGRSGIPVLSRIPYVGALFGSKTKSSNRSELLIFIQPSIVHGEESLDQVQTDMDSFYKTAADTRRFADGPGVLPPPDGVVLPEKGASSTTTTTTTVIPANPKKSSYIRR